MEAHRPGTLAGRDPEALHDLRVASRRARAALRLLPERPALAIGWTSGAASCGGSGGLSGLARDLDVFLDRVRRHLREVGAEPAPGRALLREPQAQRRKARAALALALESPRMAALIRALLELSRSPSGSPGRASGRRARPASWHPA